MTTNQPRSYKPYSPAPYEGRKLVRRPHGKTVGEAVGGAIGYTRETVREVRALMRVSAAPDVRVNTYKSKIKKPVPVKTIVLTVLCAVAALLMIINFVSFNEVSMKIAKTEKSITAAENKNRMLQFEIERKNNVASIGDYAKNDLGYVSVGQIRTVYLNGQESDRVERYDVNNSEQSFFGELLSAIGDNFREYWNIFISK